MWRLPYLLLACFAWTGFMGFMLSNVFTRLPKPRKKRGKPKKKP